MCQLDFTFAKSYFYFKDVQKVWVGGGGGGGGGKKLDIFVVYLYAKS